MTYPRTRWTERTAAVAGAAVLTMAMLAAIDALATAEPGVGAVLAGSAASAPLAAAAPPARAPRT